MDTPVLVLAGLAERADGALSPGGVTFQYPPLCDDTHASCIRSSGQCELRGKSHSVHGVVSTVRPVRLSLSLDQRNEFKQIDGLQGTVGLTGCG